MLSHTFQSTLLIFCLLVSTPATIGQYLSGLPSCATNCLASSLTSSGQTCAQADFACLCRNAAFITATSTCYASSCTARDVATAQGWGVHSCATAGVQIAMNATTSVINGVANSTASGVTKAANGLANATNSVANTANATANGLAGKNPTSTGTATTPINGNTASTNAHSAAVGLSAGASKVLAITFAFVSLSFMI